MKKKIIPYSKQYIDSDDIQAVADVLNRDFITTGSAVPQFENALTKFTGSSNVTVVCNGTAALHLSMISAGVSPEDEVIIPAVTFAASANAVLYCGATVKFADVDPITGLITADSIDKLISSRTKLIMVVDLAGQSAINKDILDLSNNKGIPLIQDSSHSLGSKYKNISLGKSPTLMQTLSFHPVKHITTGEGGAILTNNCQIGDKCKLLRTHAMEKESTDNKNGKPPWWYSINELGYNYRMTDFQAALGISQLEKLPDFIQKRREIAALYNELFAKSDVIKAPIQLAENGHSYHLYQIRIDFSGSQVSKHILVEKLRENGIGTQVHYIPLYRHPLYNKKNKYDISKFPGAEFFYKNTLSIPCYPSLNLSDVEMVASIIIKIIEG